MTENERARFRAKIAPRRSGCLLWTAARDHGGYGKFKIGGRSVGAHRVSWEIWTGTCVPDGLQLDHLCRNRACVNPLHLEPVTARENTLRSPKTLASRNSAKTHCPRGHEYTPENTRLKGGGRICRACKQVADDKRLAYRMWTAAKELERAVLGASAAVPSRVSVTPLERPLDLLTADDR